MGFTKKTTDGISKVVQLYNVELLKEVLKVKIVFFFWIIFSLLMRCIMSFMIAFIIL